MCCEEREKGESFSGVALVFFGRRRWICIDVELKEVEEEIYVVLWEAD